MTAGQTPIRALLRYACQTRHRHEINEHSTRRSREDSINRKVIVYE